MRTCHISNNFKGGISEQKGILHCDSPDYVECFDEYMKALLSEPFSTRRLKKLSRPNNCMLYGELAVDFLSTYELLYPETKFRLRLIRARRNYYMIRGDPNVSLGIGDCSLYALRIALKDDYNKQRTELLAGTHLEFN